MARTRLVAGNWKMHGSRAANRALLEALVAKAAAAAARNARSARRFRISPRWPSGCRAAPIAWGAQNVSEHAQGAYTGEVSAAMLTDFGCRYVIVGHSERRQLYGESDAQVAAKFAAAQARGLTPILCVGETLAGARRRAHRRSGGAAARRGVEQGSAWQCGARLRAGLGDRHRAQRDAGAGAGRCTRSSASEGALPATAILYGGSVKPQNAAAIFAHARRRRRPDRRRVAGGGGFPGDRCGQRG